MLSLFPQILFLAPLALTLLRVVLAIYLAYIAWYLLSRHAEIEHAELPIIGHARHGILWLSAISISAIAALLFIGAWTQVVAIFATVISLKQLVFYKRLKEILPFPPSTCILLLCISLTLIVSGAGGFAFDLPL
ncbi:hypothetical protein HY968_03195 [Candidatus Kaiserbacteria bacterium]|nr:hypothetical protein [Candidatus Kaiserbacteria bacterium]